MIMAFSIKERHTFRDVQNGLQEFVFHFLLLFELVGLFGEVVFLDLLDLLDLGLIAVLLGWSGELEIVADEFSVE